MILNKDALLKKRCDNVVNVFVFSGQSENVDHLFVECSSNTLWNWITLYNNFYFTGTCLNYL